MTDERFAEVDRIFAQAASRSHVPAIAYGIVLDGALVHAEGIGTLVAGEDLRPDTSSAFRIASMSKSFTGTAVMRLVAQGRLHLDDPVADLAPELADWQGPTADAPPLTLRHLLWMEAGLPTDDAWADRHLDATPEELDSWFAAGATFAWTPGTAFEYSNLGWALIGRIVERATGTPVQRLVQEEILSPLGMDRTRWIVDELPTDTRIARGHRWQDGTWLDEGQPLGDGGLAPMGGLWSTVEDLSRWVTFFMDAFPPRDDTDDAPLSRAGRREMQQLRRIETLEQVGAQGGNPAYGRLHGYGVGLMPTLDPVLGYTVGHSGGLPGFGSHMRWIPDRGIGIVALGNVTYARMGRACFTALEALERGGALPPARGTDPSPALVDAGRRLHRLLGDWNEADAAGLFADNVDPDESLERRRAERDRLVARLGDLGEPGPIEADTPMRGWMALAGGRARVELWLNAGVPPRVQFYGIEVDPAVITDGAHLARARGAYVVLRPRGVLAEGFAELQRGVAERLGDPPPSLPAAHVSLAAFGDLNDGLGALELERIADVVRTWAAATGPLTLESEGADVFEEDRIPVVRLAGHDTLRAALSDLRSRSRAAGLPPSSFGTIADGDWVFHLSLAYPEDPDPTAWESLAVWLRAYDAAGWRCTAPAADLIAFDGGPERWIGRYRLTGDPAAPQSGTGT